MVGSWNCRLALAILAVVMALPGVAGAAEPFVASKLGGGGGLVAAYDPETSDNLVVWTSRLLTSTDRNIVVRDLSAETTGIIGSGDGISQTMADVSSDRVVYEQDTAGDINVRIWDRALNVYSNIAATADDEVGPRIDGNLVVWHVPDDDELRFRDISKGYTATVPSSGGAECWDVDNGCIVWSRQAAVGRDEIWRFRPGVVTVPSRVIYFTDSRDVTSLQLHRYGFAFTIERSDGMDDDAWFGDMSGRSVMIGCVDWNSNAAVERNPVVFHRTVAWQTNMTGTEDILLRSTIPSGGPISDVVGGWMDIRDDHDISMFGRRIANESNDGDPDTEVWLRADRPEAARTSGANRYLTAIETSKAYFRRADNVVLCTGLNFPDALAAAPLARMLNAPLLLTRPAALDAATLAELARLQATDVWVVGGVSAVSNSVMSQIASAGMTAHRIHGSDRYKTSVAIANKMASTASGPWTVRRAFFTRGDNFPDALAVGPVAAGALSPILLVHTNGVPDSVSACVDTLNLTSGVIVGGSEVVSNSVRDTLRTLMIANGGDGHDPLIVDRWFGVDRYATAIDVIENGLEARLIDLDTLGVVTGSNFPDALGGGAALGCYGSPLLLTRATLVPNSVMVFLQDHEYEIGRLDVFGGSSVVSNGVRDTIAGELK